MAMEKTNVKVTYEAIDEAGNGQRVTFEQLGLGYPQLLEFQQKAILPMVANINAVVTAWGNAASAKVKPAGTPTA